jgi:small-conductance mechanosensitive channel
MELKMDRVSPSSRLRGGILRYCSFRSLLVALCLALLPGAGGAQTAPGQSAPKSEAAAPGTTLQTAYVVVDGRKLFRVIGVSALPASKRAQNIADRIYRLAADPEFSVDQLVIREAPLGLEIVRGETPVLTIVEGDARLEGVELKVLAAVIGNLIKETVTQFRRERSPGYLAEHALYAAIGTVLLVLLLYFSRRAVRFVVELLEHRYRPKLDRIRAGSFGTVATAQFWQAAARTERALWWLLVLVALYVYTERVLSLFPWTRSVGSWLLELILDPLRTIAGSVFNSIPDLAFLVVLFFVVRYLLNLLRLFFLSVGSGAILLPSFEPDWAVPLYKLVRLLVIVAALVMAYPYIPGSQTDAFKGISVFAGVLFSIGSSSLLANALSGYALLLRRAFMAGDRVKIGEHVGDVVQLRQDCTVLRTPKNEEVTIPNSTVMGTHVVNFSKMAREKKLILHSTVTIGYDAPWRQVEAMLLEAAERTPGLPRDPKPFVLKTALNDFYVNYEINVYCDDASRMPQFYSSLHQNILDAFNEHGVQIMSPHFRAQPEQAVVVPKEKWFEAPAQRDAVDRPGADKEKK